MIKIVRSFSYAWNGIKYCFVNEVNFRCHCFFSVTAITLSIALHISTYEWLIMLLTIAFVICLEIVNTVVEKICNIMHPGKSDKIKVIKDMAAASVLVSAMASFII